MQISFEFHECGNKLLCQSKRIIIIVSYETLSFEPETASKCAKKIITT